MNNNIENISVIGLGKLGGTMAACFASKGFNVVGSDINRDAVDSLNQGKAPSQEIGLDALVQANQERLSGTMSVVEAISKTQITFVIVPTPSDERGAFTLDYAKKAFAELGRALAVKDGYHVIVMTSTVLPGSTRHGLLPILESESGKKCGPDFGLCYNPEFIALGSVIKDFLNPDFYLLGQFDERSGDFLELVHNKVSENGAPTQRMNLENAELAKIAVNSFVTMKISYANTLADLCEKIPGGDIDIVSDALGMDSRIGRKYLTGGFGFGGPCFPRDNVALAFLGSSLGSDCSLLKTNDDYNRYLSSRQAEKMRGFIPEGSSIAVLGLSYKPNTHVIEESPGIYLCEELSKRGYRVFAHDDMAAADSASVLEGKAEVSDSLHETLKDASVVIITKAEPSYVNLNADEITRDRESTILIDFWRLRKDLVDNPKIQYMPSGICLDPEFGADKFNHLWS
jgi:UDPglucose 6-dehydrogenase